jgi:hypothetical protein
MLLLPEITAHQLLQSALAVPAFAPVAVCPGYAAAWITGLHNFRRRSLVERLCWSLPLSLAVSGITSYLLGRYVSFAAVVLFFIFCTLATLAFLILEDLDRRRTRTPWPIGLRPLGTKALLLLVAWTVFVLLSLVDIQHGQRLFMNVAMADQGYRIHWTESILLTGVPPENPLYLHLHPAPMRNYYFFYILCAVVAATTHLAVRAVLTSACVWTGLALIALGGLYQKHILGATTHLRGQFLRFIALLLVSGLDILVSAYDVFVLQTSPPADLDLWSENPILGWFNTLLWAPHHVEALLCCMLAFLLVWKGWQNRAPHPLLTVAIVALALASSFGISVYVTFAFFLVMMAWAAWTIFSQRPVQPVRLLAAGGACSLLLLIPFLFEIMHGSSGMAGNFPFGFTVRQMIPPDALLETPLFSPIHASHPILALNLARFALLLPGYLIEFGFSLMVLLIYLIPAWRSRNPLSEPQRVLLFLSVATLPFITFIRSQVLRFNDFGFRAPLIIQFCLLLLAAEFLTDWKVPSDSGDNASKDHRLVGNVPGWIRSLAALMLVLGILSAGTQALWARCVTFLAEASLEDASSPSTRSFSHNAYISALGYAHLDSAIPRDAVVQFNPVQTEPFWIAADQIGVNHLTAISGDKPWCGAELGGDPSGCLVMAPVIDALYRGQDDRHARAACTSFGIQFLVVRIYDPAWSQPSSWVWTLPPVVADREFRALDCRSPSPARANQ